MSDAQITLRDVRGLFEQLNTNLCGEASAEWLAEFKKFLRKEKTWVVTDLAVPGKLSIDRSTPFNPVKFIGAGWSIWKGPKDGDGLVGEELQDARSLAVTELDLFKLRFEHCLKEKERSITGEIKLARLKEDDTKFIRLDARIAQALREEPGRRTLEWIRMNFGKTWFDFPGTEVRHPNGDRCVVCLTWRGSEWYWDFDYLSNGWNAVNPSLVLAS